MLTEQRDAGRLTWTQWAADANVFIRANMRTSAGDNLILAKQGAIAEAVDSGRMSPAEGRVAVAQLWADYDRSHPNPVAVGLMQMSDSLKNQPLIPPQQPVVFSQPTNSVQCSQNPLGVVCSPLPY